MYEALGRRRNNNLKGRPGGHRRKVLVKDCPCVPVGGLVPDTYIVVVDFSCGAFLVLEHSSEDHGVRVAVEARVTEVGVVVTAVLLSSDRVNVTSPVDSAAFSPELATPASCPVFCSVLSPVLWSVVVLLLVEYWSAEGPVLSSGAVTSPAGVSDGPS